ncbi:transposon Tf2-6 polyprotein [Trichonephila clavipes]|nr:transposon Tf2-6 polyprotein [Trichonephila clavipes]
MRYDNYNTGYENYKKKVCFNCGDPNNISQNCMYKNEEIKCFRCEVFGHKASECPDNNDTKLDVAHLIINKEETLTKKVLIDGLILDALIDSGSRVTLMRKSVYDKINHVQLSSLNTTSRGFSNSKVRVFGYFKDDIQIDDLKCNVEICVVNDDAMLYDVIIGLNVLMQGETIINENGITIRNKPKCTKEVANLSVLPINLSPDDIEINIAPDIPQIYESKNKTVTPNCVPVKKDGLHVKDDQRTVTVSPVVKVSVELQHPSDLPKLEDDLKRFEKPDPMIKCITGKPDIVDDTEELHLENCLKDVKEDMACIPLKKTDPVVVVPESVPKEVKRRAHEKRRPRLKENKDYYFIPKRRQKIENSVAYCDHRVLFTKKDVETRRKTQKEQDERRRRSQDERRRRSQDERRRRSKTKDIEGAKTKDIEGARRKTYLFPALLLFWGFVSLQCRLEDQPIPGWPCGAGRYFQATPIILLLMLMNALSVLGASQSLDAGRGESRRKGE